MCWNQVGQFITVKVLRKNVLQTVTRDWIDKQRKKGYYVYLGGLW